MASPQIENGHIDIANEIAETLAKTKLSGYETRYLWVLWRKTYGWHKKTDIISNSQFVQETGIHKQHIYRTEQRLLKRNIVTKNGYEISFQKDYTRWRELPKMVTVTKNGKKVTKNGGHKRNYTNNILTKDKSLVNTETKVSAYGKPEINKIISYLKERLSLPILDGSEQNNRRYAQLLLKKAKNSLDGIIGLINITAEDDWYKNNITSVKNLYYNAARIMARKRGQHKKIEIVNFEEYKRSKNENR